AIRPYRPPLKPAAAPAPLLKSKLPPTPPAKLRSHRADPGAPPQADPRQLLTFAAEKDMDPKVSAKPKRYSAPAPALCPAAHKLRPGRACAAGCPPRPRVRRGLPAPAARAPRAARPGRACAAGCPPRPRVRRGLPAPAARAPRAARPGRACAAGCPPRPRVRRGLPAPAARAPRAARPGRACAAGCPPRPRVRRGLPAPAA
ncbi:hypothetical protein P7K49_012957, partial [Saguinus oedipus]